MINNALFWADYFERLHIWQISTFEQAIFEKLIPAFDKIEEESKHIAEAEYERLGAMPAAGDVDLGDLAEDAQHAALVYYEGMSYFHQGLLNLLAAGLYHLFEQQFLIFHRHELLDNDERSKTAMFSVEAAVDRLGRFGIVIETFPAWDILKELRLVANAVKHAEGRSSNELLAVRPEIFVLPALRSDPNFSNMRGGEVYSPLAGQDIFVTAGDLRRYSNAIRGFWMDLASVLRVERL